MNDYVSLGLNVLGQTCVGTALGMLAGNVFGYFFYINLLERGEYTPETLETSLGKFNRIDRLLLEPGARAAIRSYEKFSSE